MYYFIAPSKGKKISTSHIPFFPTSHSHTIFAQLKKQFKNRPLKSQWCWRRASVSLKLYQPANFTSYHGASGHLLSNSSPSMGERQRGRESLAILHAPNNKL